jgi:hypothetical protein
MTFFWFNPFANELSPERREKTIMQFPPAYRETVRKMCDFRPGTCERCRQLRWQGLLQNLCWRLELLRPTHSLLEWWAKGKHLRDLYDQHLMYERHVVALLPPAKE